MADSLILKGVKDVRKHTGTEMLLVRPKRGGDTHQVKEWWRNGGVSTCYCDCTIFNVTAGGDTVKLVLDTSTGTDVRIDHDGSFNFSFYGINELKRAALYTADFELIEHYVFPSISGGKIMTVTPAGAPSKPGGGGGGTPPAVPTIGTVTLTGSTSANDGDTEAYTVSISGDASPSYVLTSSDANDTVSGLSVTYSGAGARTLTVTATDGAASDSPATGTLTVNASVLFSTRVSNADLSYAVTVVSVDSSYGSSNKYALNGNVQQAITLNANETIYFDLSDASLSGHPLKIYTDSSKTTEVTVGVEQQGTDLLFTPPIAGTFSYQCQTHADMGADITVS